MHYNTCIHAAISRWRPADTPLAPFIGLLQRLVKRLLLQFKLSEEYNKCCYNDKLVLRSMCACMCVFACLQALVLALVLCACVCCVHAC